MNGRYFSMEKFKQTANITIYGDITSYPWNEGDTSSASLSKQLEILNDVTDINVYINSYGGEVAEGLAIYNALKRHKAKVTTYCDGFACSIASVIFMAGDKRVMNESSLLMIHNAWTWAEGNADQLRKQADDLEKINQASVEVYKAKASIDEKKIKELMNAETWLLPEEAVEFGFATSIEKSKNSKASQNAFSKLAEIIKAYQAEENPEKEEPEEDEPETDDGDQTEENETETETDKTDETEDVTVEPETEEEEPPEEAEEEPEKENPDETEGEETEEEKDDDESTETDDEAVQKWNGFFNSLLKL